MDGWALLTAACEHFKVDEEEAWRRLHFLCPQAIVPAADIVDSAKLTKVVAKTSRRSFFLVKGSKKNTHHLTIPGLCTCSAYKHTVCTNPQGAIICKHALAGMLGDATARFELLELSDDAWVSQFCKAWQSDFGD